MFGLGLGEASGVIIVLVIIAVLYFVPTFIATGRKAKRDAGIFLVNLLLGWTLLGWVVALIWSVSDNTRVKEME